MMPMGDENPLRRIPWATLALIAACVVVYFAVQPSNTFRIDEYGIAEGTTVEDLRFVAKNASIPCELVQGRPLTIDEFTETFAFGVRNACNSADQGPAENPGKQVYLALIATMFLHASIPHLLGNLLFLWVFGNNIEDRRGWWRYLLLYLVGGIVATFAHVAVDPDSTVPIIGASGAVAAVMGAYLVCYPSTRVKTMVVLGPVFFRKIKAAWLLVIWFAMQSLLVFQDSGIAWAAHVGGFVFGALVGCWWRWHDHRERDEARPAEVGEVGLVASPGPGVGV